MMLNSCYFVVHCWWRLIIWGSMLYYMFFGAIHI
jgi:hypothetical protein